MQIAESDEEDRLKKQKICAGGVGAGTHGSDSVAAEVTVSDPRTKIQQHTKR